MKSCRWMAAHLQLLGKVTNSFHCALFMSCAAWSQTTLAHWIMEKDWLLTSLLKQKQFVLLLPEFCKLLYWATFGINWPGDCYIKAEKCWGRKSDSSNDKYQHQAQRQSTATVFALQDFTLSTLHSIQSTHSLSQYQHCFIGLYFGQTFDMSK